MVELTHAVTGVVIRVSEEDALRLGPEWAPAGAESAVEPAAEPAKRKPGRPKKAE